MGSISRQPCAPLRPFVQRLWASDATAASPKALDRMERVLPTGAMHVVVRTSRAPLVLFDGVSAENPRAVGHALIGGARSTFYVRSIAEPSSSVGAQLRPGAAPLFFGVPSSELAERHTKLDEVWGPSATDLRERLAGARSLEEQLTLFEATLLAKVVPHRAIAPVVTKALAHFEAGGRVEEAVQRSGYSHRAFIKLFREAVGLTPKTYGRIRRFQRALAELAQPDRSLAALAADAGYSDQAHFSRELTTFAGVSPTAYMALSPTSPNHVRVTG